MSWRLSDEASSRIYRLALTPWLLLGHGLPKLSHWWFGLETWGPHIHYRPQSTASAVAALIEFVCPILILLGLKVRISSMIVATMLVISSFGKDFPLLMERVVFDGHPIPLAVIMSKEIIFGVAMGYFALALFGRDEKFWRSPRPR